GGALILVRGLAQTEKQPVVDIVIRGDLLSVRGAAGGAGFPGAVCIRLVHGSASLEAPHGAGLRAPCFRLDPFSPRKAASASPEYALIGVTMPDVTAPCHVTPWGGGKRRRTPGLKYVSMY